MQPAAGTAQAAHGPAERGQDGRERLCRHLVATHQYVVVAQGQQHRLHAVSENNYNNNNTPNVVP